MSRLLAFCSIILSSAIIFRHSESSSSSMVSVNGNSVGLGAHEEDGKGQAVALVCQKDTKCETFVEPTGIFTNFLQKGYN